MWDHLKSGKSHAGNRPRSEQREFEKEAQSCGIPAHCALPPAGKVVHRLDRLSWRSDGFWCAVQGCGFACGAESTLKKHYTVAHDTCVDRHNYARGHVQQLNHSKNRQWFRIHEHPPPPALGDPFLEGVRQQLLGGLDLDENKAGGGGIAEAWLRLTKWHNLIPKPEDRPEAMRMVSDPKDDLPGLATAVYAYTDEAMRRVDMSHVFVRQIVMNESLQYVTRVS